MPGLGDAFVGGFSPEDWMLGGQTPPQNPPDQPWGPSWLQKAQAQTDQDIAAYQKGGIPAMLGNITDPGRQDLMSGFGGPAVVGRTKAVGGVAKAAAEAAAPAAQDVWRRRTCRIRNESLIPEFTRIRASSPRRPTRSSRPSTRR
jgi:hypothetical protein